MKTKLVISTLALLATACGSTDSDPVDAGGSDSGPATVDSGMMTVADSGPITAADSGPTGEGDSGPTTETDSGTPGDAASGESMYTIRFAARAGSNDLACGTPITGIGMGAAQTAELVDFRFYVHGIELLEEDGTAVPLAIADESPWQNSGVALLDFEDGTGNCINGNADMNADVHGMAPTGTYTGVRFRLGVPFEQNHQAVETAGAPLNVTGLFWNWQGGYKFARLDVNTAEPGGGGGRIPFNVHLGSTGCDGSPAGGVTMCMNENRPTFELMNFDPETSVIVADYAELVEGVDLGINTAETAPGCMSGPTDPECGEVFPSFGLNYNGAGADLQDFFALDTM